MKRLTCIPYALLAVAVCATFTLNSYAQGGGNPEDYYIFEYYLQSPPKPPEVVKEETVRTVVTQNGANRISRSFRKINKVAKISSSFKGTVFKPRVKAGSMFDSLTASVDANLAHVDDDTLGGSGSDRDAGFLLTGTTGDNLSVGLGYSHNRYKIGGRYSFADSLSLTTADYKQQTSAVDMFTTWTLGERWAVGAFVNQSWIDIEDVWRLDIDTLLTENVGDSFSRWGGGFLVSYNIPVTDTANLGITNTISSMNKTSVSRFFDDEDSAWLCMFDWDQSLGDNFSVNAFFTLFNLLDPGPDSPDSSYEIIGLDVSYRLGNSTSISIGVDTTVHDKDRNEIRLSLGLVMEF